MKKSISIHLNGHLFHLEEEGYRELSSYLQSIKEYFSTYDDNTEIVEDIEARLAEKFSGRKSKKQVIETAEVRQTIAEMGRVEDFVAQEEASVAELKSPKRLFRDKEHGIIAGVCAGIANYFGIDPIWVRIGFIVLSFAYYGESFFISCFGCSFRRQKRPRKKFRCMARQLR